jgi:hydroxyacid-oxoacid transhydrogenase
MSYALSGGVRSFRPSSGYEDVSPVPRSPAASALLPHGMSVVLSAPAVFQRTAHVSPRRHWEAARALGAPGLSSTGGVEVDASAVGDALSNHLVHLMQSTSMPNGLTAVGFTDEDVPALVKGTQAQQRLLNNAPGGRIDAKELDTMFRAAMRYW